MADFLFDIGKVLLDFDFESSLSKLLPADHPDPTTSLEKLLEKKDEFETGRIAVSDYTTWAPNLPMWETVRKLATEGHRLILFSNTNAIHCPWVFEAYPEFSLFHGSILSFEVDSIKPHPEIYQHAIDKHSIVPENTLYIDDLPANIATGDAFGFRTHQYNLDNHKAFEHWLPEQLASLKTSN